MSELDEPLVVTRSVRIPVSELSWRFSSAGGPGGQHVNTSNTRVELVYEPESSTALGPVQRQRVITALGSPIRVVEASQRSQMQNRRVARDRLAAKLRGALEVKATRRATRPTRGSQRRRLDAKTRTGTRKSERSKRYSADD